MKNIYLIFLLIILSNCSEENQIDSTNTKNINEFQIVEFNNSGAYKKNQLTGEIIKPILDDLGNEIKTGTLNDLKEIKIDSNLISKPFYLKQKTLPRNINVHLNHKEFKVNSISIPLDLKNIKKIKLGNGEKKLKLKNHKFKIIKTGVPYKSKGQKKYYNHIKKAKAEPFLMKDNANLNIQYLDVDQGLNSSFVNTIIQDKKGNIWIGATNNGVCKYDGVNFEYITKKEGLIESQITSILEDNFGNLWFGNNYGDICKYDGNSFTKYTTCKGINNSSILSISKDKKGNLWFATFGFGLIKFDGKYFTNYSTKEGLNSNYLYSFYEDSKGIFWIGTDSGVCIFDGKYFQHLTEKNGLNNNIVKSIIEDKNGNMWFATYSQGVNKFDGKKIIKYSEDNGLTNNYVIKLSKDSKNNILFITESNGFDKLDGNKIINISEREGLSENCINCLIEDLKGNFWIGTNGGGICKFNASSFAYLTNSNEMPNEDIRSILEDSNGDILFGTCGFGLNKYNYHSISNYSYDQGIDNNFIFEIIEDSKKNIWLGTFGGGVCKYDNLGYTFYKKNEGLSSEAISTMFYDHHGNLWIGTYGGGLNKFDGKSFSHFNQKSGLCSDNVNVIFEDSKNNLWIGAYGSGISKIKGNKIIHYTEKEGLSSNNVTSFLEDKNGNFWIGTEGGGVNNFNGKTFTYYTEKEGLSNNIVMSIVKDQKDNFFVGTSKGLNYINQNNTNSTNLSSKNKNVIITSFDKNEGLKNMNFNLNSVIIDSKNFAWWGTGKSVVSLDLNNFKPDTSIPKPFLNQIDINEEFIDFRHIPSKIKNNISFKNIKKFENYPEELVLSSNLNHLMFHFIAVDVTSPHKIKYQFMLKGLDEKWNPTTDKTFADYRNIPFGNYTFKIRAIGDSKVWSKPFEYKFTILPPWWQTWWFRIFVLLFSILFLVFLYKLRTKKLRNQKKILESTVQKRTADVIAEKKLVEIEMQNVEMQKQIVEKKNKEILDSLTYAKRIQSAILPQPKLVKEYFKDSFILYKPKDIVAGDFYWFEVIDNSIFFAAADCTGHGVPGAMVSVVCHNALNRSVKEFNLKTPDAILNKTREIVIEEFEKSNEDVKDGMDISLCVLNSNSSELQWSGAHNPLWIVRKNEIGLNELIEVKADKQPIGKFLNAKPFTNHILPIFNNDLIYLFTDGFQDQFGGPNNFKGGKKFKVAQMRELFISISNYTMEKQREIIDLAFENWKENLEQVDDVCIIGVKINSLII